MNVKQNNYTSSSFLSLVAENLHQRFGNDMRRLSVVVPNKRAKFFFNQELGKRASTPIRTPWVGDIQEFLAQQTNLTFADEIALVNLLYQVFLQQTGCNESLEEFLPWGMILCNDFDNLDKNLVDPDSFFINLKNYRQLESDSHSFLDEDQVAAIKHFFSRFDTEAHSEIQQRFFALWEKLGNIYHAFRQTLRERGCASEGMMFRESLKCMQQQENLTHTYAFVGFNALTRVERQVFKLLKKKGKALFFWDYDQHYVSTFPTHEAGEHIRENLKLFPNELPESCFNGFEVQREINLISCAGEVQQTGYLHTMLSKAEKQPDEQSKHAVVLCNESLLIPVLTALPECCEEVNITMGFPLKQTPIFGLLTLWIELQTDGYRAKQHAYYHQYVSGVLQHRYVQNFGTEGLTLCRQIAKSSRLLYDAKELAQNELLSLLFTPSLTPQDFCETVMQLTQIIALYTREKKAVHDRFDNLYQESLFKTYTTASRLLGLLQNEELAADLKLIRKLLLKILKSTNIPFKGEPPMGLQVMGILETRNLDFDTVTLLSLNEGKLPQGSTDPSFIPYSLQKAYGMTTYKHREAVYAYHFYRLLQRARKINLLFSNGSTGVEKAEPSRFIWQLLCETSHHYNRFFLTAQHHARPTAVTPYCKSKATSEVLLRRYDTENGAGSMLSPTALNRYLSCRLRFYYQYVCGLTPPNIPASETAANVIGSIFHRAAELIYKDLSERATTIDAALLTALKNDSERLNDYINRAYGDVFDEEPTTNASERRGASLITTEVIKRFLQRLIEEDLRHVPFSLTETEKELSDVFTIQTPFGKRSIRMGGIIDRIDVENGTVRIVDYKTGGEPTTVPEIASIFNHTDTKNKYRYLIQVFFYAMLMKKNCDMPVKPAIIYLNKAEDPDYSPNLIYKPNKNSAGTEITDFAPFEADYKQAVEQLLTEIFSDTGDFAPADEQSGECKLCDFRRVCRRGEN